MNIQIGRKIYRHLNKLMGMKYLLFIVLMAAVVITAGCVGGSKETVVTPTPTSTIAQDPIVGSWRSDNEYSDIRYQINPDGTLFTSEQTKGKKNSFLIKGTWRNLGNNSYGFYFATGYNITLFYDAVRNGIYNANDVYDNGTPVWALTPYLEDVPVASSSSASTPTYSSSSSSGSTHLSGSGDDVQSFTATGTGLRIFTMSHTGSRNFAVVLKDSGGNYMTLLANEIGSYSGKKSERLTSGTYYLDIKADGSWTIDISSV
jgi:hypothetical protein